MYPITHHFPFALFLQVNGKQESSSSASSAANSLRSSARLVVAAVAFPLSLNNCAVQVI
jgi:hypothetical protein